MRDELKFQWGIIYKRMLYIDICSGIKIFSCRFFLREYSVSVVEVDDWMDLER